MPAFPSLSWNTKEQVKLCVKFMGFFYFHAKKISSTTHPLVIFKFYLN